jgi:hypothetical protein
MSGELKLEILLHRVYNYTAIPILKGSGWRMFFVCELGMPIIFVFYMMIEAEPTSEMCFNFKKKI